MLGLKRQYFTLHCLSQLELLRYSFLEKKISLTHCTSLSAFWIQVVKMSHTEKSDCIDTEFNCCCCVSCRLCVICLWKWYIIYNLSITDICSLGINNHSCEVEQAWLINICRFDPSFDCFVVLWIVLLPFFLLYVSFFLFMFISVLFFLFVCFFGVFSQIVDLDSCCVDGDYVSEPRL